MSAMSEMFRLWTGPVPSFLDPVPNERTETIDDRFNAFHEANPWVHEALLALTRQWHEAGHERIGMKMLIEVLRWEWSTNTVRADGEFKLNNDYTSRYARLIAAEHPELALMFEFRALRERGAA